MRRFCLALLVLAPLIVVGPALFSGRSIGAFDQIRAMQPWNGPPPQQAWDVLQADSVLQTYAWRDLVLDAWGKMQIPQWNPYELGGAPLLANSQSGALYPPHILLGLLKIPTGTSIVLLAWLHLAIAGLGLRALSMRFGATETGGCIGGLSFQLSAFMLGWLSLASVASTLCWIPWLMFGISCIGGTELRSKGWHPASLATTAASTAMMMLGGHLQFAFYGLLSAAVLTICLGVWKMRASIRTAAGFVCLTLTAVLLGIGLSAPQTLPSYMFSKYSHRQNMPTEEGYAAYVGLALQPHEFIGRIASPFAHGNPTKWADEARTTIQFWPAIQKPGANFAESAATLGPVLLIGIALLPGRRMRAIDWVPWTVLAALALAMAMGTPIDRAFYFGIPGWSATGSPGRIISIFVLCACVLAALGFSREHVDEPRQIYASIAAVLFFFAIGSYMAGVPAPNGVDPSAWSSHISGIHREAMLGSVFAWAIAAAAAFFILHKGLTRFQWVATMTPIAFLGATGMHTLVRTGDPSFLHQKALEVERYERVAIVNEPWSFTQVPPALMPPNTASIARIHEAAGYDSLLERDTVAKLNNVNGQDSFPPHNGNLAFIKPTARNDMLRELGISKRIEIDGGNIAVSETGGMRASIGGRPAQIIEETYSSVTVRASGPGVLRVTDRQQPKSWIALVNGNHKPVLNGFDLQVELPEGEHIVEFRYVTPGLQGGFLALLVSAIALSLLLLFARTKLSSTLEQSAKSL